jgi:hypothetical protein
MRNLKLMADYNCFATWDTDAPDNVNPDELPISMELKSRIHEWEAEFDSTLNRSDPASSGFPTEAALRYFDLEGMKIWQSLKDELGSEYHVQYFSRASHTLLDP